MKKRVVIGVVVVALMLIGAGTAYYLGYFNQEEIKPIQSASHSEETETSDNESTEIAIEPPPAPPLPDHYFVASAFEEVHTQPHADSTSDGVAYYGEELKVLERAGDWIRIAPIYQLEEGAEEISQWVNTQHLVTQAVPLDGESWFNVLTQYIEDSDDFMLYQEIFLDASTALVKRKQCRLADFEEMKGWVKSINHPDSVYFTYCGGIETENKVYLNAVTGKLF